MGSIDFHTINRLAVDHCPDLLMDLIPGGRLAGNEYIVCNPLRVDLHPGSFKINVRTGHWSDFATGDRGGDLVALCAYLWGCSQREAALRLGRLLGVSHDW